MIPAPVTLATAPEVESPQLVAAVSSNSVSRVEPELPAIKHIVAEADTFWSIAQRYGVAPEAIATLNDLTVESTLVVGQALKIPAPSQQQIARYEIDSPAIAPSEQPTLPKPSVEVAALELPSQALMDADSVRLEADAPTATLRAEQDKLVESIQALKSQPVEKVIFEAETEASQPETLVSSTALTPQAPTAAPKGVVTIPVPKPQDFSAPTAKAEPTPETLIANNAVSSPQRLPEPPKLQSPTPELVLEAKKEEKTEQARSVTLTIPPAQSNASTPLVRPQEKAVAPTAPAEVLVAANTNAVPKSHVVRPGETLYAIARRYGISGRELIAANKLLNPNVIYVNQRLTIPARAQRPQPQKEFVALVPQTEVTQGVNRNSATLANAVSLPQPKLQVETGSAVAAESDQITTEAAVEKLKTDIARLRREYQQQSTPIALKVPAPNVEFTSNERASNERAAAPAPVVVNPEWQGQPETSAARTVAVPEAPQEIAAASPGNVANYNALLRLSIGETVSPDLPPLASPDEYLPGAEIFNGYIWPAKGTFTSGYGPRWGRMHRGIDIAAPTGTPIFAAASGEVITAGWNSGGYGNLVKIRHGDGSVTLYAHNSRIMVRKGQQVKQGQQISAMGSTGFSTGPHLHFEIHPKGQGAVNPMAFLPKR
ncbi:peptidase M23 [Picosynechococcus sp. PCC 7003]|uniref:peptidoglycan DD-metalloendopeptidase family protein n=1 Tax=Picosynechococcus sp. PCC 7003 TaxID=374981 RepID=UPI000810E256|nr:peptidoglycan DD-metalloendopeptidase family protein [Picosynechococcus sp. PCC 7003]ANV85714.1 peptidase M23 [Picosynechococcus sp. PCC 7003]